MEGGSAAAESPAHKRLSAVCSQVDSLPIELIGTILSYVASARDVTRSSVTCHKWREAVKGHLHRLSFTDSDLNIKNISAYDENEASLSWDDPRDVIIINSVMQIEHLYDLSISYGTTVHAAVVIALLRHTKHTLKSFTLLTPIKQPLDVLEKLALYGTPLECLVWGSAYISALSPRVHDITSLVSLTLNQLSSGSLKFEDFCLLFSIFPKLEQLSLVSMDVEGAPPVIEIRPSSSLKTLTLQTVNLVDGDCSLLVHGRNLESVSLVGMQLEVLDWVETEGSMHVHNLSIHASTLERLVLIGSLQSLVLWNSRIEELESCPLPSLIELKLVNVEGLLWPGYLEVISIASSRVSKLHLLGGFPGTGIVDVKKIASSFPCLQTLSLDFTNSLFEGLGQQSLTFQQVVVLELRTIMQQTNHELFSDCICKFLSCCPSLKRLVLMLEGGKSGHDKGLRFVGQLASLLISNMRAYPLIEVRFDFDGCS